MWNRLGWTKYLLIFALGMLAGMCANESRAEGTVDEAVIDLIETGIALHVEHDHNGTPSGTPPGTPTGEPDPPDPPGDGCQLAKLITEGLINGEIHTGPWAGWCRESGGNPPVNGPNGSRGFGDRMMLAKYLDLGNSIGVEVDVMMPEHWYGMGGAHFGGFGFSPSHWGDEVRGGSIRLDWNAPTRNGLRMTIYHAVGDTKRETRCDWTTGEQVFFDDQWTHLKFEARYIPATGRFEGTMVYTLPGGERVTKSCGTTVQRDIPVPIGEYAKWGRMHLSGEGKRETCWIRNDRYYVP